MPDFGASLGMLAILAIGPGISGAAATAIVSGATILGAVIPGIALSAGVDPVPVRMLKAARHG